MALPPILPRRTSRARCSSRLHSALVGQALAAVDVADFVKPGPDVRPAVADHLSHAGQAQMNTGVSNQPSTARGPMVESNAILATVAPLPAAPNAPKPSRAPTACQDRPASRTRRICTRTWPARRARPGARCAARRQAREGAPPRRAPRPSPPPACTRHASLQPGQLPGLIPGQSHKCRDRPGQSPWNLLLSHLAVCTAALTAQGPSQARPGRGQLGRALPGSADQTARSVAPAA